MLSSVTLYYQIISVVMIWGSQLSETADEYDVQEQGPVDQQGTEEKDYDTTFSSIFTLAALAALGKGESAEKSDDYASDAKPLSAKGLTWF